MANADLPEEEQALTAALCAQGWSDTTEVVNDTFAVLRAGFVTPDGASPSPGDRPGQRHWGVAVTCGAGINCVAVAPDGRKTGFLDRVEGPERGVASGPGRQPPAGAQSGPWRSIATGWSC